MGTHKLVTSILSHTSVYTQMKLNLKKKCSTPLVIREMQMKTALRNPLTQVRVAVIRKSDHRRWRGCGEHKASYPC